MYLKIPKNDYQLHGFQLMELNIFVSRSKNAKEKNGRLLNLIVVTDLCVDGEHKSLQMVMATEDKWRQVRQQPFCRWMMVVNAAIKLLYKHKRWRPDIYEDFGRVIQKV